AAPTTRMLSRMATKRGSRRSRRATSGSTRAATTAQASSHPNWRWAAVTTANTAMAPASPTSTTMIGCGPIDTRRVRSSVATAPYSTDVAPTAAGADEPGAGADTDRADADPPDSASPERYDLRLDWRTAAWVAGGVVV